MPRASSKDSQLSFTRWVIVGNTLANIRVCEKPLADKEASHSSPPPSEKASWWDLTDNPRVPSL